MLRVFPLTISPQKRDKEPLSFWTTEIVSTARKQDDYWLQWKTTGHLFEGSLKQINFPLKRCISKEDKFEYVRLAFTFPKFLHSLAISFRYFSNTPSVRPGRVGCLSSWNDAFLFCWRNFCNCWSITTNTCKAFFQNFKHLVLPLFSLDPFGHINVGVWFRKKQ